METPSMVGVWGLGSNSGVGILDEFLLSHGKAHQSTERLAEVEPITAPRLEPWAWWLKGLSIWIGWWWSV